MLKNLLRSTAIALALTLTNSIAKADIIDGQFSVNQIFDVQYYWSGNTLNASSFVAPYDSTFNQPTVTAGQYFQFFASTTNPGTYGLGLYNADGTLAQVVHNTGTLSAIGPDALFYLGSGFFGTVITTSAGYAYGSSASFTNMDTSVSAGDASSYTWASTTPLAAGQTASGGGGGGGAPAPNYVTLLSNTNITTVNPTSNNSPAGEGASQALDGNPNTKYLNFDRANAGFTIKLDTPRVIRGVTFTTANDFIPRDPSKFSLFGSNDGVNWTTIVNAQAITLSDSRFTTTNRIDITNNDAYFYYFITFPSIKAIDTYGSVAGCQAALGTLACDSVQIGDVAYYYDTTYTTYTVPTDGGTGTIANPGTAGSNSSLAPPGPQAVVNLNGQTITNPNGTTVTTVDNAGTFTNAGTSGAVTNTGNLTNTGTASTINNSGTANNTGTATDITNTGTFTNAGNVGNITNSGTFTNNGTAGDVTNSGTFTNGILGTVANWINNLIGINNGNVTGNVTNNAAGTFTNNGTVQGATNNAGILTNNGTLASLDNTGTATNTGTVTGTTNNSGTLTNSGITGAITNSGTVDNTGTTGTITNSGTVNNTGTTGTVTNNTGGTFNNNIGGTTAAVTNAATFNNRGTTGAVTNSGTFTNFATGTTGAFTNSGTMSNSGTVASLTNTGTATNSGTVTGSVTNTSGTFTNSGTTGAITNNAIVNNTGTTGAVTNTAGTFTNSGTTAAVTNTATFNNTGTTGAVTNNNGTFNNNAGGTTAAITNAASFNNRGTTGTVNNSGNFTNFATGTTGAFTNSGTLVNAGNIASLNNSGTASNDGTIVGDVTNTGTFANGVLGTITNLINSLFASNDGTISGTVTNNAGGTFTNNGTVQGTTTNLGTGTNIGVMAAINNSGVFTNSGTTGAVTNSGTFNSTGSSGALINSGTATISGNGSIDNASNTGNLNITGAASSGDIFNLAGGLLDFNGTGTLGTVTNAGTFNFSGSGSTNGIVNSGTANISDTANTGAITNTGAINVNTTTATFGTINNSGVFNISNAGGNIAVPTFVQASTGNLVMAGLQQFNVNGAANLNGTMTVINPPTAFGRYTMINGQPVTGTFNTLALYPSISPLGSYLKYSGTQVKLYVTPYDVTTKAGLSMVQQDSSKINNLVAGRTSGALGNDCSTFGAMGGCISLNYGTSKASTGDLRAGNMIIGTRLGQILSDNYRIGIFLDRAFTKPTIGTVQYKNVGPVVGGFLGWNANLDGTGLAIVGSMAKTNTGTHIINRPLLAYAEAGSAATASNSVAYQIKASYSVPVYGSLTATPYLGLRHTRLYVDGYTESGPVFPLSIDSYKQVTSDLLAGISFGMPITDKVSATISAGVVRNLTNAPGAISGTSEIYNMFTFDTTNPGKKYTSGALGAGLTYEFMPNHKVGVNVGWQQKSLIDANVKSFGINYTYGF